MTTGTNAPPSNERAYRWVLEHAGAVRGYLLGLVQRADVADDLAQEVFRRAWQARDRYREQGHERAYLLTIADRLACDRARRKGIELTVDAEAWRSLEPAADESSPDEELLRQEMSAELTFALSQLSPMQRRVLMLRFYGEMEFAQIAQTVGCPLGTVLSHCRRGLVALRNLMAEPWG